MLASLFPVSGAVTSAVVLWSDNGNFGREFADQNGDPLTAGDPNIVGDGAVYQIGYFDGLAPGVDPASLGGALWDSLIAISGDGSFNSGLVTTLGDTNFGAAPDSFVFQKTTFDTTLGHTLPPAYPSRLGVRFFNNTTVATSTHSIMVTSFEDSWLLSAPGDGVFIPFDAFLDLDVEGSLIWQGTAFQTSIPLVSSGTIHWQDTDSDWSQAGSWDHSGGGSAPPSSADIANFGSDATITNQPNLNGTSQAVLGITIDNGGADYTFRDTGSGSLTIGASGIDLDGGGTASFGVNGAEINLVLSDNQTWDVESGATLHYAELGNTFDFANNTLTKAGGGTLVLNENSYSNTGAATDVVVEAGTLQLEADPGTTNFAVELRSATLSIHGTLLSIERASGHSGVLEVNSTLNGVITGAGDITLKKVGTGTATIASTISGTGGITMDDANDTIRLTGNNSYSGTTTVTNGTLLIDGNQGSAGGAVSVSSLGTLGGSGTIGGVTTMAFGSQLAAGGSGATGTLSFSSGLDSSGSTWLIDVASSSDYDVVDVTGNLDITGATLSVTGASGNQGNLVIANYSGTLSGTFDSNNLPADWSIDYNYQGLNQIALIPEPSTVVPLVAILSPWIFRRRRRR